MKFGKRKSRLVPRQVKENRSNGLTSFIDNITREIKHLLDANERKYWNNLTNVQGQPYSDYLVTKTL